MSWSYAYSAAMWPSLGIVALTGLLGVYSWRRRSRPGALPFSIACLFAFLWAVGSVLEIAATDPAAKAGWYSFKAMWLVPVVCAITGFVLQYAGLGHWLTRRVVVWLLVLPSAVLGTVMVTNGYHRLSWPELLPSGPTLYAPTLGIAGWVSLVYYFALALINLVVLLRMFVVSPRHRAPVGLMILGHVFARVAFVFEAFDHEAFFAVDPEVAAVGVPFSLYAIALFGFHVFDPVPEARTEAINQMREGMLVLDPQGRVAYANPSAEGILGLSPADLQGRQVNEVLPVGLASTDVLGQASPGPFSFRGHAGGGDRDYTLSVTELADSFGQSLGRMLLLRDVTDEHRALAHLLDEQRALAALRERERLARELHDSIGQVLGYVSMQAQAADKWLQEGDVPRAAALINRLTEVAQQAHADVREAIRALKAASPATWSFLPTLREYAKDFEQQYGIATEVSVAGDVEGDPFPPGTGVQVLRVIQEAMSNARKHGDPRSVGIEVAHAGAAARITVRDDGRGIDPAAFGGLGTGHFGLTFMRERMAEVGGSLEVSSPPEGGTLVVLRVPFRPRQEVTP